ncbi:MAG: 50S ribosomal protein L6 [Proteobacteria bacterium]|nr:50S ribosomal protein L6 [Pseudomonadota bacterium]
MSRIGKSPIAIPKGVKVELNGKVVKISGPKGNLQHSLPEEITLKQENDFVILARANDERNSRALHGLTRALLNNMIHGVSAGFTKELEIIGIGYRAQMRGKDVLNIYLGHSHPIDYFMPKGIIATVEAGKGNPKIKLEGCDKQLLGEVAAQIRRLREPEPYKGKGVRYVGEYVKKKVGKAVVGSGK